MAEIEFIEENGVLRVKGSKARYVPLESSKSLEFTVSSLSYYGSVWTLDHIKLRKSDPIEHQFNERLNGVAVLQNSLLQVIGVTRTETKVSMSLVPITDEDLTKADPVTDRFNFRRYGYWEGQLHYFYDDDLWVLDFLLPVTVFAKVKGMYSNGRLERLTFHVQVQNAYTEESRGGFWLRPGEEWNAWSDILVHNFTWYEVSNQLKTDRSDRH
jgi:hypothetical protein